MTDLEAQLEQALRLGVDMRKAQAAFFAIAPGLPGKKEAMEQARHLERRFDNDARMALRAALAAMDTGR
jgi:hypothetical protein